MELSAEDVYRFSKKANHAWELSISHMNMNLGGPKIYDKT